jgi:Dpy-30 motif
MSFFSQALAKERPADPVQYLAEFLLKNKEKVDNSGSNATNEGS